MYLTIFLGIPIDNSKKNKKIMIYYRWKLPTFLTREQSIPQTSQRRMHTVLGKALEESPP